MLHLKAYLVKEQVGLWKLADTYDIYDPETSEQVGVAREEPSGLVKMLRLFIPKHLMPTSVNVCEKGSSAPLFSIRRGVALLRSKVDIRTADGQVIGYFKSKVLSLGGGFYVYDREDRQF